MKNLILALAALLALLLAPPCVPNARARQQQYPRQVQQQPTSGAYVMYVGEQPIGEETYTLARSEDGTTRTESEVAIGPNKAKNSTVMSKNRPVSFSVEAGGAKVVSAEFAAGAAKVSVAGRPPGEVQTTATVVIENGVWHHFIFLIEQYDAARAGKQNFVAFLPSQSFQFTLEVERVGERSFTAKGEQVVAEQYRAVTSQNLVFELWADPATRTPLFISIPSQNTRIVRKGWEWLAEALAPKRAAPAASEHFSNEEVEFRNGDVKLAGTLTVPKRGVAPFPAAVIITGSGGQDRDGTQVFNLYRQVAETLSEAGVAVLRVDDRGMGKSVMKELRATSYTDLVRDTRVAFDYLLTRPDIDRKRVALVGHSEGAQTALTVAADDPRVAAVVLLAGTSRPLDRVVVEQSIYMMALQEAIDPADKTKYPQVARAIIEIFDQVKTTTKPSSAAGDNYSWFREHAASDPLALAARVRVPALVLNGERDPNVLAYHAVELAQAMTRAGNRSVRLRIFPNLSHSFTPTTLDRSLKPEQAAEVDKGFLETLRKWATDVLVKQGGGQPE